MHLSLDHMSSFWICLPFSLKSFSVIEMFVSDLTENIFLTRFDNGMYADNRFVLSAMTLYYFCILKGWCVAVKTRETQRVLSCRKKYDFFPPISFLLVWVKRTIVLFINMNSCTAHHEMCSRNQTLMHDGNTNLINWKNLLLPPQKRRIAWNWQGKGK